MTVIVAHIESSAQETMPEEPKGEQKPDLTVLSPVLHPKPKRTYNIQPGNAAILAAKAHAKRKENLATPKSEPDSKTLQEHAQKLKVIEKQIMRVDELIAEAPCAKDFFALTAAKDKLLKNFYHLANIAGPGTRKPKPESTRRSPSICLPTDETE